MQRYLVLSGAILRFFAPQGRRYADGGGISCGGVDLRLTTPTTNGVGRGCGAQQTENFNKFYQIQKYKCVAPVHHLHYFY